MMGSFHLYRLHEIRSQSGYYNTSLFFSISIKIQSISDIPSIGRLQEKQCSLFCFLLKWQSSVYTFRLRVLLIISLNIADLLSVRVFWSKFLYYSDIYDIIRDVELITVCSFWSKSFFRRNLILRSLPC